MTDDAITELVHEAKQRTRSFLHQAAAHYGISPPEVEIRFNLRGQAAGQVRFARRSPATIRYNPLLLIENGERFLRRTVPHEVAHVIAHRLFGPDIRPHGEEWQAIMALLGADGSRCHDFASEHLKSRRLTQYPYHCECREHTLTSIRHNRAVAGQIYLCRACGQALKPGAKSSRE